MARRKWGLNSSSSLSACASIFVADPKKRLIHHRRHRPCPTRVHRRRRRLLPTSSTHRAARRRRPRRCRPRVRPKCGRPKWAAGRCSRACLSWICLAPPLHPKSAKSPCRPRSRRCHPGFPHRHQQVNNFTSLVSRNFSS